jgi:hypothetical protein
MITREDAERIATSAQGRPAGDATQPWELVEFDHGWLIVEPPPPGGYPRGGASSVVERDAGRLIRFPSSISHERIRDEYLIVRERGHEVETGK